MRVRTMKIVGMTGLVAGLAVYCVLVVILAVDILPIHWAVDFIFYLVAGVAWIIPARWIIMKINRENDD